MRYLLLLFIALGMNPVSAIGQSIELPSGRIKVGDSLRLIIKINENDKGVYQVASDFKLASQRFRYDTALYLGKIEKENIYNFAVTFDSTTRYFQCYVPSSFAPNATPTNFFERPFFRYPEQSTNLLSELDNVLSSMADDIANLPALNYVLSFKLYDVDASHCVVVYGQYSSATSSTAVQPFLRKHIQNKIVNNIMLQKLVNEMIATPLVVGQRNHYPALSTGAFTLVAQNATASLYSFKNANTITIYIKPK